MTQTELTPTTSLTGKWKPYPAYKDSGVEWLGEIPAHWEVKRLKFAARLSYGDLWSSELHAYKRELSKFLSTMVWRVFTPR